MSYPKLTEASGVLQPDIAERAKAADYLRSTQTQLLQIVDGLTEEQMKFRPSADSWSIADIVEHLVIFEGYAHNILEDMPNAPLATQEHVPAERDAFILHTIPDRLKKITTPEPGQPIGRWAPAEAVAQFRQARARTLELLETSQFLRGHILPNPLYGPNGLWDGFEWILGVAAHTVRHTEQAAEVRRLIP
jgi:hypothetical protein